MMFCLSLADRGVRGPTSPKRSDKEEPSLDREFVMSI
jgi:hypothetical protein